MLVLNEFLMRGIAGGYRNVGQISGDILDDIDQIVVITGTRDSGGEESFPSWGSSSGGDTFGGNFLHEVGFDNSVSQPGLEADALAEALAKEAELKATQDALQKAVIIKQNQEIIAQNAALLAQKADLAAKIAPLKSTNTMVNPLQCKADVEAAIQILSPLGAGGGVVGFEVALLTAEYFALKNSTSCQAKK